MSEVALPADLHFLSIKGEWNPSGGHWFGLDFIYEGVERRPLGKQQVRNRAFKKCCIFKYFAHTNVSKEIIVSQRITSQDNSIRLITPQDNCSGVFFITLR